VIAVVHLGRVSYAEGLRIQEELVALRKAGRLPNTLLLLEHDPVITLGRNAKLENVVVSREQLAHKGVELFETNRGGDVTYHGPGQLVGYPIFDLRSFSLRIGAVDFIRKMEEIIIRSCAGFGIPTQRVKGLTGVWTREAFRGRPSGKIAAIGIHISRGVTSHGFALNVSTDLENFRLIIPCGIPDKPVTSLDHELALSHPNRSIAHIRMDEVLAPIAGNFGLVMGEEVRWYKSLDHLVSPVDLPARAPEALRRAAGDDDLFLA
jgi:lipoyl(octanoyl) transferase